MALVGVLILMLVGAGIGWWKQDLLRERYQWCVVMRPSVLTAEQEKATVAKPGSDFKECANGCPTMIVVTAGKFMMGRPTSKMGEALGPQHEVTIAKPFAVGKFDVTFDEWDQCTAAGVCPEASDGGWGRGNRPVINISWTDAQAYIAWLSRITGKAYRLLSEAEWEYAARAGTTTDQLPIGNANCDGCSPGETKETVPVGSFKPNAFGLYDMQGNVWQWVEDRWHVHYGYRGYDAAPNDGRAWLGGTEDWTDPTDHVIRGGSWNSPLVALDFANRVDRDALMRSNFIGFRVARALAP
jgi:formylglycine-generating enzyme required for sulfatase activity